MPWTGSPGCRRWAEVVAVREDLVLVEQHRAARVDQVDAGQAVGVGDLLRAQVLLHRHRVVGAAGDRGVVGDDHAAAAFDEADAGHDARGGDLAAVHFVRGDGGDLEEGAARVEQLGDALAGQQLAAGDVALAGLLRASLGGAGEQVAQVGDERLVLLAVGGGVRHVRLRVGVKVGGAVRVPHFVNVH